MLRRYLQTRVGIYAQLMSTKPQAGDSETSAKHLLSKLRNKTGYPLVNCKQALKATDYDMKKAEEYLLNLAKEKGWKKMRDISSSSLNSGLVGVAKNKTSAAIVEVNCGTDFVAKTQEFQRIVKEVADIALNDFAEESSKVTLTGEDLMKRPVPGKGKSLEEDLALVVGKLKEGVLVRRAAVITAPPGSFVASYIHPSMLVAASKPGFTLGSFAAVATLCCPPGDRSTKYLTSRGRDLCQHIVGMRPLSVGSPSETAPPPEAVEGGEGRRFGPPMERSSDLLRQPFLLDAEVSVEEWLEMADLQVHDFVRFNVGEK